MAHRVLFLPVLCNESCRPHHTPSPPISLNVPLARELHCGSCFSREDMFPDERTPTTLFDGIPFQDMPICNIRVSPNNTIFTLSDAKGTIKMLRSCGIEGFKNARKGTNIAAQATAISISTKALERGYKTVRVRIRGLGPGRMSAIKGLQMGGLNIISITDSTPVSWNPPRARKRRRL
ncbi:unnamed protein product [Timema podura]|uniref:Ribosomal protein S11 n=1 Tax=Timema podura TaxID=61482 RepID=A0ABN7NLT6_TIMPD|nr:unnamed protein product [Timema podura]